jgi:hypothetical protein
VEIGGEIVIDIKYMIPFYLQILFEIFLIYTYPMGYARYVRRKESLSSLKLSIALARH